MESFQSGVSAGWDFVSDKFVFSFPIKVEPERNPSKKSAFSRDNSLSLLSGANLLLPYVNGSYTRELSIASRYNSAGLHTLRLRCFPLVPLSAILSALRIFSV
jgi:hypothetical protein